MTDNQPLSRCVHPFDNGDYAACANEAITQISTDTSHELLQLLLISLQRLGQTLLIKKLGAGTRDYYREHLVR